MLKNWTKAQIRDRIARVTEMAELGTVECKIRKVVKANDKGEFYKLGSRTIVMTCLATLKAGIKLDGFTEDNVKVDTRRQSVRITLPHAEVLTFNIPPEEVVEEWYGVGLFRSDFTDAERNDFLRQAEEDIQGDRELIRSVGILEDAERGAEEILRTLLSGAGFTDIDIEFK